MAGNNDINDPNSFVLYRFHPSIAAAIIFIILFGITTISVSISFLAQNEKN
jgi:hypothetical protein